MNTKISTKDVTRFICDYYHRRGFVNHEEDWELIKKYKNFKGETCRDLVNNEIRVKVIVVVNISEEKFTVIENEDFSYFLKLLAKMPVFYYIPAINNDGLIFIFESASYFEQHKKFSKHPEQYHNLLRKKLLTLYNESDLLEWNNKLQFAFPNANIDDVVRKLERNQMTLNPRLADLLNEDTHQAIIPDIAFAKYRFPQDDNLTSEDSIEIIFGIMSSCRDIDNEELARLRLLLKKVRVKDYPTVKKIALGFKKKKEQRIVAIFDAEENRKKADELVNKIWNNKLKKG